MEADTGIYWKAVLNAPPWTYQPTSPVSFGNFWAQIDTAQEPITTQENYTSDTCLSNHTALPIFVDVAALR